MTELPGGFFMAVAIVSEFTKKVLILIKSIPRGKVATYKQIAELAGKPQGSRGVSWILHSCSTQYKLPWHRVLNSKGRISFDLASSNYKKQKRLLEAEGVVFAAGGELSLKKFQWKKAPKTKKSGAPRMFGKKL
jgi:methylated-DNA-protein-cysteine methyltransferase-like protein